MVPIGFHLIKIGGGLCRNEVPVGCFLRSYRKRDFTYACCFFGNMDLLNSGPLSWQLRSVVLKWPMGDVPGQTNFPPPPMYVP